MKLFDIITLFPQAFPGTLDLSVIKKSRGKAWDMRLHDMRKFGVGNHYQVDDQVFGGFAGMLIRPDVIDNAMKEICSIENDSSLDYAKCADSNKCDILQSDSSKQNKRHRIFLSPRGKVLNQNLVEELAYSADDVLLLCGRYEGVDARAIEYFQFEEISIGNYILAGAEVAAMVMMEAIIRKIPGVLGNLGSMAQETFVNDEISEPRYTRPAIWKTHLGDSIAVDQILLSGNHKKIAEFQKSRRKKIE